MTRIPGIELGECTGGDSLQHLLGEDTKQLPADVERLEDSTIFVGSLGDEVLLELGEELQVQKIVGRQGLLTDDSLHGLDVLADSIASILQRYVAFLYVFYYSN